MRKTTKVARLAAALATIALIVAACGGSDAATTDTVVDTTAPEATPVSYPTSLEDCANVSYDYVKPATVGGMTITYDINPAAVWEDGSQITVADFKATWDASLNTPGSISTSGYDQVTAVEAGSSDKQVVVTLKAVYAPWRGLFGSILKAAAVKNTADVSADFADNIPFSGRPYKIKSWSPDQIVFVPNDKYWGTDKAVTKKFVMVPKADSDTEIASIKAGEVDFVYPQFFAGIEEAIAQDNIAKKLEYGGDYEGFYFQQKCGPFADPNFRAAFSMSIDRDALFKQIYIPLGGKELLQCGPMVPGPYCNGDEFANSYDPAAAEALLTENGWTKGGDGFWVDPSGKVPDIRWIINTGNTRRENTQAYLIPLLNAAGFKVRADNCDAACYFQKRLPGMDFDMAMYISTAPPDPAYLTGSFACDLIPTEANKNIGQNSQGWCNAEASDLMYAADVDSDAMTRADKVKAVLALMAKDHVMLPLMQFPKSGFWRTDKVGGPVDGQLNNYAAFNNIHLWTDVDGDGQIVFGAEQWPECLNPITECANSSWMVWTTAFQVMPGAYATTNDGKYAVTNLLAGEAKVEVKN
ncbi:MAG: ABC transporter substrate-binding protein [Actinobacteria bacterium]|nr:ABC transporter substrate-binding protein [Actinomycetota bacterium]